MSADKDNKDPNVIPMRDAKRRLEGKVKARAGASKSAGRVGPKRITILTWVQLLFFLVIVAYMMQLCRA